MAVAVTWLGTTDNSWNTASNWSDGAVPEAGDDVSIPAASPSITSGLDQSAIDLGDVRIEKGFVNTIGDVTLPNAPVYLQLSCDYLDIHGACTSYIDFSQTGTVDVSISDTAVPDIGKHGCYLIGGSALEDLSVTGGHVAVAQYFGESLTIADVRVNGGVLTVGRSCAMTDILVKSGTFNCFSTSAITTLKQDGGTVHLFTANGGTWTVRGGTFIADDWTGTPSLVLEGGTADFIQGGRDRTLSALTQDGGAMIYDPDILTITTRNPPTKSIRQTVQGLAG